MADIPSRRSSIIAEKFIVEENTFKRAVTDNPKDKIEIEIGDAKQSDFKPQAKIMRWDNEVNFSLRAKEHPEAIVRTEGKVIKYVTPDYEVHQYELDPGEIGEDGGLEFEWILPKKPESNVLTATIQTKELDFFYQPALTQKEIDEGSHRPENVVGSYAVYHKTKGGMNRADGMEYKTGKAFHIYRPKVTDKNGEETWAELNIDEESGELTITIDQEFLEKAVYPIIVDPTFGYTSVGATATGGANTILGNYASLSVDVNIVSITTYLSGGWGGGDEAQVGIYDSSLNYVADSAEFTDGTNSTWYNEPISAELTAGSYAIVIWLDDNNTIAADTGQPSNSQINTGSVTYVPPNPSWPASITKTSTLIKSIYATYNAKLETLTDNFNDNSINATIWNNDNASETGGQMVVTANTSTGTYNGIASDSRYDLTESSAFIELVSAGDTSLSFTTYILELYNDTIDLYWGIEYGATDEIVAYKSPDSSTYTEIYRATYDSSVHKWFRIREASGTVYWDTSADGTNWTNRDSDATGYDLTALNVFFGVGNPGSGSTTVTFDNFNVAPAITTLSPSVSDSSTITESVTVDVSDPQVSASDSATITDSLPSYSQTEQATITESVGLLITTELNVSVSDSATITEAITTDVSDPQVSVSDSATITESVTVSIIDASALAVSVSDNASITESVSATVSDPQVNASDSSTITESVNVALQTGDIQISVSDSATITDSLPAYSYTEQATITESVGLSIETPAAPDDLNVSVSDTITVTDFVDYTDDFNRADSTDIGANWWVGNSGDLEQAGNMQIVSNQLTCIAEIYSNDAIYLEPISQADSYTQVTWISSFTGDARIALYARSDSNAQNTYLASFRSTTGDVLFYNHLNGAVNLLYDGTTTHTYEAGDVLKITVINNESNNPVLRAYVNDTLMGEYEDASANKINTSGYAGIRMSTGTETVDDFEAGPGLPGIQITTSDPQVIVSDSSTITESVTVNIEATPTPTPSVSDSITITEDVTVSIGALATPSPNVSDSATITESVTVSIQETNTATPAATDTATITDSVTVDVSDPQIAVSDSATITESVSISVGGRYSKNDRLGLDIGSGLSIPLGPKRMATWGTNARPANAVNGMIGYNTELQQVELYQEGAWYKLEATPL